MIVTCTSCLTKFNLDDSRIPAKGARVRCSQCKHIFYIVPPSGKKEEVIEGLESFAEFHKEMMESGEKKGEAPSTAKVEEEVMPREEEEVTPPEGEEEEEEFIFSKKAPSRSLKRRGQGILEEEERPSVKAFKPKERVRRERRGPSLFLALIIVLLLLVFGVFYFWSELGSGGKLSSYLEYPITKITDLWDQIWGVEKEGLIIGDYGRYEEKIGEVPILVIEGKVTNQSRSPKKYIKVRVVIFDQNKAQLAEKEAICGRVMSREELKSQPSDFFQGEMVIQPQTEREKIAPSGQSIPFMVVFKDLHGEANEFAVEIVEAPNL
jgi:predicted Zn finger-like uncharacterized protein